MLNWLESKEITKVHLLSEVKDRLRIKTDAQEESKMDFQNSSW